jgi:hypothetical protein
MKILRARALAIGPFFALAAVLAVGCVSAKGTAPVGAAEEAVTCEGCPNLMPVSTYNYEPPHAFPGTCAQANPEADGAIEEMMGHCRQYCGQSNSQCGVGAEIEDVHCVDRDIGHRWEATCVCGSSSPEPGPYGGAGAPLGPVPYPPGGGFGAEPGSGFFPPPFPGFPAQGPSPLEPSWQGGQIGWQQPPWSGPGWQPPAGYWDAPHGIGGLPPGAPETGVSIYHVP